MLRTRLIKGTELTPELTSAWSQIQRADPALDSPYFRPEFTQAVARVRPDVEVAVLESGGEPVGFFPFQRANWSCGKPVGGRLSDFHGAILKPGLEWDPEFLLRDCSLATWDFDHLPVAQERLRVYHQAVAISPFMDLSQGFEAYHQERRTAKSDELTHAMRKARKLEREVGPLRFEWHTADSTVFETLLRWKSEQYHATNLTDVFAFPWTVALLKRVLELQEETFRGVLSALYVGDRLLAMHLGMRSHAVLHSWFPAYDRSFSKYSPGLLLLTEIARAAPGQAITRIDLGKGGEQYKTSFASGSVLVAEGSLTRQHWVRALRSGWVRTRDWVKSSPLRGPARLPARLIRRYRDRRQFQ